MAYALTVDCWDEDGKVRVRHVFYGDNEREARDLMEKEFDADDYLAEAEEEDRIGEFGEPISNSDVPRAEDYEESSKPDVIDAEVVEED